MSGGLAVIAGVEVPARAAAVRLGPGLEDGVGLGPLVSAATRDKVACLVTSGADDGGRVVLGGGAPGRPGCLYLATVLGGVAAGAGMLRREIFGLVAPVVGFARAEEAIALASGTVYGVVSCLCSAGLRRALQVAEALEAGMVGISRGVVSGPAAPFGGVKQSGIGREGGPDGLVEFTQTEYVAVDW